MNLTVGLDAPCSAAELFTWVDDLDRYPQWLSIVTRAERVADGTSGGTAWAVELRGRLGPLARSKRLRMVRTELVPERRAVFERDEADGRRHAAWVLRAEVSSRGEDASRLDMTLHYGGSFWGPVLERLLSDEIDRSRGRLLALVSA